MKVAVSGSTGFIGGHLKNALVKRNHTLIPITRESFHLPDDEFRDKKIEGTDAVIHLAGAPIARRWSNEWKEAILRSRVDTTRKIVHAIIHATEKPKVFISLSGIGIYDSIHIHTEESQRFDIGFLGTVCKAWEEEANKTSPMVRLVILRTGMVVGPGGGALQKMYAPFSIGLGGTIGKGDQAVSFIHYEDLCRIFLEALENEMMSGVYNAVAPYPTTNYHLTETLGKVLNQPAFLRIPSFLIRLIYGEGAQIMTQGQRVYPERLEQMGFKFLYHTIDKALFNIYRSGNAVPGYGTRKENER